MTEEDRLQLALLRQELKETTQEARNLIGALTDLYEFPLCVVMRADRGSEAAAELKRVVPIRAAKKAT